MSPDWLQIRQGAAPLILSLPHTGRDIPADIESRLVSLALGRKDTDWWVESLYDFAGDLDATIIRTGLSRTVIDVNRDPSGASLYPGQATSGLCPLETFDGEPLYRAGQEPDEAEIARRRTLYFEPYHAAMRAEIARLKAIHPKLALYDAHSIRSVIPRLFDGMLPNVNIGTNGGASCAPLLQDAVSALVAATDFTQVVNGRFRGGWITRHYGDPAAGLHAIQIELACRSYLAERPGPVTLREDSANASQIPSPPFRGEREVPDAKRWEGEVGLSAGTVTPPPHPDPLRPQGQRGRNDWPVPYDPSHADPLRRLLVQILTLLRDRVGET
jgi:formiminoglutamase